MGIRTQQGHFGDFCWRENMAAQRKHAKVISSDIDITMTKTFFRQLCIYQKYYSHIQIRSHTPSTSWVDFNGISWKRVRWMTRLKQPHGTLRLFSRNRLVRWKADSERTVVTWRSICVNNINKQQNTHGNKRFWQSKWKKSLILGRNGPFCVFFPSFVSHFVYFYSFEISCSKNHIKHLKGQTGGLGRSSTLDLSALPGHDKSPMVCIWTSRSQNATNFGH